MLSRTVAVVGALAGIMFSLAASTFDYARQGQIAAMNWSAPRSVAVASK